MPVIKIFLEDIIMLTGICILIGSGIGALVGAFVSTTEKGKEMDENLKDALSSFDDKVLGHIPDLGNILDKIGGK